MKKLVYILVLFSSIITFGQEDILIESNEVTEAFVNDYIKKAINQENKDSVYFYYNRAMLIAQKIEYVEGEIRACEGLIDLYQGDKNEVYEYLRYSLLLVGLYEKNGTPDQLAGAYHRLGQFYFREGLYSKTVEIYSKAIELNTTGPTVFFQSHIWHIRSLKHEGNLVDASASAHELMLSDVKISLMNRIELQKEKAEIYHALGAYEQELEAYNQIESLIDETRYAYLKPVNWNNIGYTQKYLQNFSAAKRAFYKTISADDSDNNLTGGAYFNLGLIYQNVDKVDSALVCFERAKVLYQKANNIEQMAKSFNMEAMIYYQQDDQFNAHKSALQAIDLSKKDHPKVLAKSYEIESFIHQDLFEFEQALESYKKYLYIRDSLLVEERNLENKLLFDQYKVEQIEKQLRLIWAKNERDLIDMARMKAEKEAEKERFKLAEERDKLRIADLQVRELKAKEELQELLLIEERLNLENKQKELELSERESELKEMALEKERLIVQENENEIQMLAQKNELEKQRRLNEEQEFRNTIQWVAGILLFIFLILIGFMIAYRQLRKRKKEIEKQALIIAASKKEIEQEKEKSEGLLLNILPHAVADELKVKGSSEPKLYNEVSVGFTDFSGFTMISEIITPQELVKILDSIFYEFDVIIERYGLERIKTIGDAYMFAAGLPEEMTNHAEQIVRASLEMRDFIDKHNQDLGANEPHWNIRVGVNTGPVVAGVIGIKKFAYDIWGDTVNTAARMESSGQVGKVNVSGSTYAIVKDKFHTEYRGKIEAKNKGEIDMYFVEHKA